MNNRQEYLKKYRLEHKEKYREYQRKYRKNHLSTYEKLQQQNQKYKEVIDKAIEELKKGLHELDTRRREEVYIEQYIEESLNILIKTNDKI